MGSCGTSLGTSGCGTVGWPLNGGGGTYKLPGASCKSGTEGFLAGKGLGSGDLTGIDAPANMVGAALAPWAGPVVPATPTTFGASCMTSGGGAEGKARICSTTSMLPWRKDWLMSRRLAEAW